MYDIGLQYEICMIIWIMKLISDIVLHTDWQQVSFFVFVRFSLYILLVESILEQIVQQNNFTITHK